MSTKRGLRRLRDDGEVRLHLGCGPHKLSGWINVDLGNGGDIVADATTVDEFTEEWDTDVIFSNAFFEHLWYDDHAAHLESVHRALKGNGILLYTGIPNFKAVAVSYLNGSPSTIPGDGGMFSLYNAYRYITGAPARGDVGQVHKAIFDPEYLREIVLAAGFKTVLTFTYFYPGDAPVPTPVNLGVAAVPIPTQNVVVVERVRELLREIGHGFVDIKSMRFAA